MPKIAFFDTKQYDRVSFDTANQTYGFGLTYFPYHLSQASASMAAGHNAICAFVNDVVDATVIQTLLKNGVRLIALRCAGYNNIDLKAAYGNIHVARVPAYSPHAVAEHAVALMLTLNRKTHRAYSRIREGNFSIAGLEGFDMFGKTAGVIGTGKIGRCLVDILNGFGMDVLLYDPYPNQDYAEAKRARYVSLEDLYRLADIISLHCPLTPQTMHMINEASIRMMKDSVMIINTGRGKLIKTSDLIDALKTGKVGSAGLDVYEEESDYFFEDFSSAVIGDDVLARLLTFPNVLVTPHQGFLTNEALHNIAETTLANIKDFFSGGGLKNEICYHCDKDCRKKQGGLCF